MWCWLVACFCKATFCAYSFYEDGLIRSVMPHCTMYLHSGFISFKWYFIYFLVKPLSGRCSIKKAKSPWPTASTRLPALVHPTLSTSQHAIYFLINYTFCTHKAFDQFQKIIFMWAQTQRRSFVSTELKYEQHYINCHLNTNYDFTRLCSTVEFYMYMAQIQNKRDIA